MEEVFGPGLEPYFFPNTRFQELKSEGREPPPAPTGEETEAAELLRDKNIRRLLFAIKTSGGLLVKDLGPQLPLEAKPLALEIQSRLGEARLIESEVVVVCTKTQAQTTRASARDVLARLSAEGLRCACGRPIGDEGIEEALTITALGRELLEKSRWLTVLVVKELEGAGVPREHILVEQQLGGDEIDCLTSVSGETVLFELKDKEFNLGNAYSFGAKIGITRPDHAVIVTTEHVGQDARDHFERARLAEQRSIYSPYVAGERQPARVQYIEGVEALRSGIRSTLGQIYSGDAARVLDGVLPLAFPRSQAIVEALQKRDADPGSLDQVDDQHSDHRAAQHQPETSAGDV